MSAGSHTPAPPEPSGESPSRPVSGGHRQRDIYTILLAIGFCAGVLFGFLVGPKPSLIKRENTLVCHELFLARGDTLGVMYRYKECVQVYLEHRHADETAMLKSRR